MIALVGSLAACGLPRSGPNRAELLMGSVEQGGDTHVIEVTDEVTVLTAVTPSFGFSRAFLDAPILSPDTIRPGDVLRLTFWENVNDGILTTEGAPAALDEVQVDNEGMIFVPYAGRIRAADHSPEALRRIISDKLNEQTPDPQVMVTRLPGNGATVSIMGGISAQGVYPIERPSRRLSGMLASAGGVRIEPEITLVTVQRGRQSGQIWLLDLYEDPDLNIALRDGDRIIVEEDTRSFTSMGATGSQTRVQFASQELSALDALARVGGLRSTESDPTGIFILREERPEIANAVLGRADLTEPVRMIYVLSLTEANGLFRARDFMIRDEDTIYVTEAPYVQWNKTIAALTGTLLTAESLATFGE